MNEFEGIAQQLNQAMQTHQRSVVKFKDRLNSASSGRREPDWADLSGETERILRPTLALADQVARSYDQLKQQSNMLLNLQESRIDPLTGVGNRRMFNDSLESQIALYHRYGTSFSLVLLDIDHFKKINDTRGHLHGDHALTSLGGLLAELARETDQVARYGDEEFTVILPETERRGAAEFAERLRVEIEERLMLTVSIGVAATEDFGESEALLQAADWALYAAKEAGRNRVFFSTTDDIVPLARPNWIRMLARPNRPHNSRLSDRSLVITRVVELACHHVMRAPFSLLRLSRYAVPFELRQATTLR
ncbi:MAG: hypothetical protein CMJ64_11230 [Planctomycetaceae bacterium]|nr:hypothetical protein [Planctomycetaceae bacterium]